MQPSPCCDTSSPWVPSLRFSIVTLLIGLQRLTVATDAQFELRKVRKSRGCGIANSLVPVAED